MGFLFPHLFRFLSKTTIAIYAIMLARETSQQHIPPFPLCNASFPQATPFPPNPNVGRYRCVWCADPGTEHPPPIPSHPTVIPSQVLNPRLLFLSCGFSVPFSPPEDPAAWLVGSLDDECQACFPTCLSAF